MGIKSTGEGLKFKSAKEINQDNQLLVVIWVRKEIHLCTNLVIEVALSQDLQVDLIMREEDITNAKKSTEKDTNDLVTSMNDQDRKKEVVNIDTENAAIQTNVNEEEKEKDNENEPNP